MKKFFLTKEDLAKINGGKIDLPSSPYQNYAESTYVNYPPIKPVKSSSR